MVANPRFPIGKSKAVSDEEEQITHRIIGSAMEVHRVLGPGFLEAVYQAALARQFEYDQIPCERECEVTIEFKGAVVGRQRLDFMVAGRVILELKAVDDLSNTHKAQLRSYLKATGLRLGLLINFNQELLQVKRVLHGGMPSSHPSVPSVPQ